VSTKTPFQQRLENVGDKVAAEQLGVKERTVKAWRLGDRRPRLEQAREIQARWPVTFEDIYYAPREQQQAAWDGRDRRRQMA
jgi:DNA-binding XRE family transcriptional regulator